MHFKPGGIAGSTPNFVKRVRCFGCPADPFPQLECVNNLAGAPIENCVPALDLTRYEDFDDAVIERPLKGRRIETAHERGWTWEELKFVDPVAGGATRAEIDAFRLLATFLAHLDNKAKNQRFPCQGEKLVGISRVYLGVHYPTDVIGGWIVEFIWASVCWLAAQRFEETAHIRRRKPSRLEARRPAMLTPRGRIMKHLLLAVVVVALALPSIAFAQGKPNFSGTWAMDPTRSESATQAEPIGPVTVVITQTAVEFNVETTRARRTTVEIYKLDGSESKIPSGTGKARWDGSTLVVETVRDIQGAAVTTKESRTLEAGGDEMRVESILEVQHGYTLKGTYGTAKDVYKRVRP